jgi:DNA-binding winged helix-turn-helix (wHTH) protein
MHSHATFVYWQRLPARATMAAIWDSLETFVAEARSSRSVDVLAPRVRAVVAYMARHPRRIVGIDELREAAWAGADRKPKRLAHYIAQARRVLGDDGREPRIIRTVYGVGYQYIGPPGLEVQEAA